MCSVDGECVVWMVLHTYVYSVDGWWVCSVDGWCVVWMAGVWVAIPNDLSTVHSVLCDSGYTLGVQ